jgi:hypothetical protein
MFKGVRVAVAGLGIFAATAMPAFSQGTLRIGMTAADIPLTTGQPDQGFEGFRFAGYTIYDALVNWDLSKADVIVGAGRRRPQALGLQAARGRQIPRRFGLRCRRRDLESR